MTEGTFENAGRVVVAGIIVGVITAALVVAIGPLVAEDPVPSSTSTHNPAAQQPSEYSADNVELYEQKKARGYIETTYDSMRFSRRAKLKDLDRIGMRRK